MLSLTYMPNEQRHTHLSTAGKACSSLPLTRVEASVTSYKCREMIEKFIDGCYNISIQISKLGFVRK